MAVNKFYDKKTKKWKYIVVSRKFSGGMVTVGTNRQKAERLNKLVTKAY